MGACQIRVAPSDSQASGTTYVANFEPRNDDELDSLSDEKVLSYIADAYAAGQPEHAQRALGILTFRYYDSVIVPRVALKVPQADIENVAGEVLVSAIRSSLEGRSVGEFRTWLNRIVSRRIADYSPQARRRDHRAPGGARRRRRGLGRGPERGGRDRRRRGSEIIDDRARRAQRAAPAGDRPLRLRGRSPGRTPWTGERRVPRRGSADERRQRLADRQALPRAGARAAGRGGPASGRPTRTAGPTTGTPTTRTPIILSRPEGQAP